MTFDVAFSLTGVSVGRVFRRIPHSLNTRLHWRARAAWNKQWKEQAALWALLSTGGPPPLPKKATVTITLHSIRQLDTDNAYTCVKPILDGLKGILIVDDSPDHITLRVEQQKVAHRAQEHVHVRVRAK